MIGKTIGEYRILVKRGEGGMGMFYKATDLRLDRIVGLKTVRAELLAEPELLEKLQSEAKALAQLDHPNVARLLHYLVVEGQHFIVMEYVEGLDLAEIVRESGLLPIDRLCRLVSQVCRAIGYAHSRHVIHRDLKPSNILVTGDDTVKVTDFGIAKILGVSSQTRTGVATGSLPFMAPEQIRGSAVDARTDIYQLGVTLFELATGQRPFVATTEYEMMTMHLEQEPPPPSTVNPRVKPALEAVILKALAKQPEARFASARDFDNALQAAVTSDTVGGQAVEEVTKYKPSAIPPSPKPREPDVERPESTPRYEPPAPAIPPPPRDPSPLDAVAPEAKSKRPLWIGIAATLVVATLGVWWFSIRVPAPEVPSMGQVSLTAHVPESVPENQVAIVMLRTDHPHAGMRLDTLQVFDNRIRHDFSVPPDEGVGFVIKGYDASGLLLFEGRNLSNVSGGGMVSEVVISLTSVAPPPVGKDTVLASTDVEEDPVEDSDPTPTENHNFVVDILPFSARRTIERLWIDGREQNLPLPVKAEVRSGRHVIRWSIGSVLWTDTASVGSSGVKELQLFEPQGHGRLNVAALFAGSPGYADILLDGVATGSGTPAELRDIPAGPHEITLERDGFRMKNTRQIVRIQANLRTRIQIEMVEE